VDDEKYDLIISNPPYYSPAQKTEDSSRNTARFEDALPFEHLFYGASKLLDEEGVFAVVIPYEKEKQIIQIAQEMHLFPQRITRVKGNLSSTVKRSLIQFQFTVSNRVEDELILEKERHIYTPQYRELVKDFYLKL